MIRQFKLAMLVAAGLAFVLPADAQYGRKPQKKGKSEFAEHLWVGGFVGFPQFGRGIFIFGVTPMAGYEVAPGLSMGPLLRMEYRYEEVRPAPNKLSFSTFDVGPGAFLRYDFLGQFFAQLEYESAFIQIPTLTGPNEITKESMRQDYFYVGAGFASGGDVSFSTSIHFNVLDGAESVRFPWDIRFGIRWNIVPLAERSEDKGTSSSKKKKKKKRRR